MPGSYPLVPVPGTGPQGVDLEPAAVEATPRRPATVPILAGETGAEAAFTSRSPLYFTLSLGDAGPPTLAALDESLGTHWGYDRLRIDANLDGRLVEAPVEGALRRSGAYQSVEFEFQAPARYRSEEGTERVPVAVRLHGYRVGDSPWRFDIQLMEHRVGTIATARGNVHVMLADSAMRAVYSAKCTFTTALPIREGEGPELWLTSDPVSGSGGALHLRLGAAQWVNGELFRFQVDSRGRRLEVARYDGPVASTRLAVRSGRSVPLPARDLTLKGVTGCYEIDPVPEVLPVPPGDYYSLAEARQSDAGGQWTFRFRSRKPARLAPGAAALTIGGPLRPWIAPGSSRLSARRGQQVLIPVEWTTASGHDLIAVDRDSQRPGLPPVSALVIVRSPRGRVVAQAGSGFA